jgi:hypothetical protein
MIVAGHPELATFQIVKITNPERDNAERNGNVDFTIGLFHHTEGSQNLRKYFYSRFSGIRFLQVFLVAK